MRTRNLHLKRSEGRPKADRAKRLEFSFQTQKYSWSYFTNFDRLSKRKFSRRFARSAFGPPLLRFRWRLLVLIQFLLKKIWVLVLDSKQKGNNNGWQKGGSEILKLRIRRPDCFFLTWPIENRIFWSSIYVLNVWTLHSACAEFEATTFAGNWKIRN